MLHYKFKNKCNNFNVFNPTLCFKVVSKKIITMIQLKLKLTFMFVCTRGHLYVVYKVAYHGGQKWWLCWLKFNILNHSTKCNNELFSTWNHNTLLNHKGQACYPNPCGINAECRDVGRPVCSCPAGYRGDPLTRCIRSECLDHIECAGHLSCRNGNCENPCIGLCGINADCTVRNHIPVCSCPRGYCLHYFFNF